MNTPSLSTSKIKKILMLPKLDLVGLEDHFNTEQMPAIDPTPIGRHRLLQAFRNRYGVNFRNVGNVSRIIDEYDHQVNHIKRLYRTLEE